MVASALERASPGLLAALPRYGACSLSGLPVPRLPQRGPADTHPPTDTLPPALRPVPARPPRASRADLGLVAAGAVVFGVGKLVPSYDHTW